MDCKTRVALLTTFTFMLSSCTFNPFTTNNDLTGSATGVAVGAAAGAGTAALIGQTTNSGPLIAGGIVGGALGYYVSSLRFASGGVIQGGGQVFTLGDYATIEIPTDRIFDTNSDELLGDSASVLDSAVTVLRRYPDNNIMVSGNTSGFSGSKWELKLSEARARKVAAYLWAHGISQFQAQSLTTRRLTYTGFGNYFPIANNIRNDSIRQNSRIQITAYPTKTQLHLEKHQRVFDNVGELGETKETTTIEHANFGNEFSEVLRESDGTHNAKKAFAEEPICNSVAGCPARPSYRSMRSSTSEEDVWGSFSTVASADQTDAGDSVEKQGGFTG